MRIKFGLKEGVFKKLAVGIMLSVLLSAAACGSGIEFAPDSFKPSGTKAETKAEECYSFAEESIEPVVYDAEKLAELKKMLKNYSVEYGYEELFDYEKATEGISVDHTVESHQYSALDVAGKLTKEHLCEIVQENNEEYLKNVASIIKKVDKKRIQEICEIITDVTNDMLEQYPEIDKKRVYCNLGNLKIVEKVSALDYAAVEENMVLHINRGTAALLDSKSDASMYNVIVHETMHILQFGCDCERKNGCARRCGLAHYYDGQEPQYSDWIWLGEGSAERMACLYMDAKPMTYMNHVNYIMTLDLVTTLREDVPENYMETIYFFSDAERLYSAFNAVTEEEKQEIYQLVYALNIMQTEPEGVKQSFYENYGTEWTDEVRDDVFNKIKRPILKTVTKTFYTNLADVFLTETVSKNDVLFLVNLYESTMNRHLHLDDKKYDGYNEEFLTWYKECRTVFFDAFDNISSADYEAYTASVEENVLNADMKWYAQEKKALLFEEYKANACKFKVD